MIALLSYLPGDVLIEHIPLTTDSLYELGALLAELQKSLKVSITEYRFRIRLIVLTLFIRSRYMVFKMLEELCIRTRLHIFTFLSLIYFSRNLNFPALKRNHKTGNGFWRI